MGAKAGMAIQPTKVAIDDKVSDPQLIQMPPMAAMVARGTGNRPFPDVQQRVLSITMHAAPEIAAVTLWIESRRALSAIQKLKAAASIA